MKILIACEFSGIVLEAFRKKGHDAWSCDLLPTDKKGQHIVGDVLEILDDGWDLMIAHPPCYYICNSGVCWFHKTSKNTKSTTLTGKARWDAMRDACIFFNKLKNCKIPKICIENPIPHKYAKAIIGDYTQIIQPWMFGHMEQKATCLWLKNLPKLVPTNNVKEAMMKLSKSERQRLHMLPPSKDRWKIRSTTFSGLAKAIANQWG